jgi:hypothetical protein
MKRIGEYSWSEVFIKWSPSFDGKCLQHGFALFKNLKHVNMDGKKVKISILLVVYQTSVYYYMNN